MTVLVSQYYHCKRRLNIKKEILEEIVHVFDPLGLLSPCLAFMKILLQELWKQTYMGWMNSWKFEHEMGVFPKGASFYNTNEDP